MADVCDIAGFTVGVGAAPRPGSRAQDAARRVEGRMKNFLLTVGFVAGVFFLARFAGEKKATAMVDVASAMGRDGRSAEALQQLDDVQSWFSWTEAAKRIEGEREIIRRKTQAAEAQGDLDRR